MRERFGEYYLPSDEELRSYLQKGCVVLDANVLLGLYELSAQERDQVLSVLESVRERLWIPYQVGLEYQRNRANVIQRAARAYEDLNILHGTRRRG